MRASVTWVLPLLAPVLLVAQVPAPSGTGRVTGTVIDSLSGRALAGARVDLVHADDPAAALINTTADSLGRFHVDSVPAGEYLAAFEDPLLDSLGVETLQSKLTVRAGHAEHLALATPSGATLAHSYCGGLADTGATGVVVGILRDAATRDPLAGASIVGQTPVVDVRKGRLHMETLEVTATANDQGSFLLCGLPIGRPVDFAALAPGDSSGTFTAEVPPSRILLRDVFVGPAADSATGTIAGRVVSAAGTPIHGARVLVPGTTRFAVADDSGRFVVRGVPLGTRDLYTRAIGYFPDERVVDVVAGGVPLELRLATMQSVLDTVHVYGQRVFRERQDFERRKQMGFGTFFERSQLDRLRPGRTSDILRDVRGFFLVPGQEGQMLMSRGHICEPVVVIDDHPVKLIGSLDDIDMWVLPNEIQAMEVYQGTAAPIEYQSPGNASCATIMIWTNPAFSQPIPK